MSIHAADALMEIFGFKRVANDEKPLDNQPSLDDDGGSLNEVIEMDEVKNEGLEVVAWEVYYRDDGSFNAITRSKDTVEEYSKMAYDIHPLCRHSEALAGYAVRDARITELELPYTKMCERMWELESERDQLRAELAELKTPLGDGTTGNKADLYEEVWHAAKAMGYGNVTGALNELAAIKAQEPVDGALLDDCEECSHPEFGLGYFFTDDCVRQLYAAPVAKQVVMPDKQTVLSRAVGLANRMPGAGDWCVAEFTYDEISSHLNAADQEGDQDE